jgi:hypothetical protein
MTAAFKKSLFLVSLLFSLTSARGQTDSISIDSITGRIKAILEEYNEKHAVGRHF